jgi:hypothetical protein
MRKLIALIMLIALLFIPDVYASRKKQTPWWTLKRHWDSSVTKDDKLCLEYMSRVEQYDYIVPHSTPIRNVAVLPPPPTNRFALKSLGYFEEYVLFNMQEMTDEYLMEPRKWTVTKGNKDSYEALRKAGIYDEYISWVEAFINYRSVDKALFAKMKNVLNADTFLLLLIGQDRPGAASALIESEAYYQDRFGIQNVFLFNADEAKIVWEYGITLPDYESYKMTRWRGVYRFIFKTTPIE